MLWDWFSNFLPLAKLPYVCIFAVLVLASFGLPIPEDIPLLTGGYLCYRGLAYLPIMIAVAMVGVLCGDFILFLLGRRWGHHIVEHRVVRRLIKPNRLLYAEKLFGDHGIKILFAARFLPGLRPMLFVAAGVLRVSPLTFVVVDGLAASISVPALILLGLYFGNNLDALAHNIRQATYFVAFLVTIAGLAGFTIYWHRREHRKMAEAGLDHKIDPDTLTHLEPGAVDEVEQVEAELEADRDEPGEPIIIPDPDPDHSDEDNRVPVKTD